MQKRRRELRSTSRKKDSLAQQLVDEALIARAEADLHWLDRCEERLMASDDDGD